MQTSPSAENYLREAKALYQEAEFQRCIERLKGAASTQPEAEALAAIEVLSGVCHHSLGNWEEARRHFRLGLKMDPTVTIDVACSPKTRRLFMEVAKRVSETTEQSSEPAEKPHVEQPIQLSPTPELRAQPALNPPPQTEDRSRAHTKRLLLGFAAPASLAAVATGVVSLAFGLDANARKAEAIVQQWDDDHERLFASAVASARISNALAITSGVLCVMAGVLWWGWLRW
jgi:hypothetical protein